MLDLIWPALKTCSYGMINAINYNCINTINSLSYTSNHIFSQVESTPVIPKTKLCCSGLFQRMIPFLLYLLFS